MEKITRRIVRLVQRFPGWIECLEKASRTGRDVSFQEHKELLQSENFSARFTMRELRFVVFAYNIRVMVYMGKAFKLHFAVSHRS